MSVEVSIASQSRSEGCNRSWKSIVIKKFLRRKRTASVGVTSLNCTLGRHPNGIFATCKRGGFVLQRATKPAKELIAQNPPQDCLKTPERGLPAKELIAQNPPQDCLKNLGPGFRKVSGGRRCSRRRQQVAAGGSKQAAVESKQGSLHGKVRDNVQKWREIRNARLSLLWYSVARGRQQENSHRQVGSARASPLAFSPVASQPRHFSNFPTKWREMRNARFSLL